GANNDISDYLKDLHRRIKNAWSPPRGQPRTARVLFRIKKDGGLSLIRITLSSGDPDTDQAAIQAVRQAANRKLPEQFSAEFLDVQYTFSYNLDQIQEVQ